MVILICAAIAAAVILFVGYPLVMGQRAERAAKAQSRRSVELSELIRQKEAVYAAIKELDFDFRMGKLSEEDHRQLVTEYKREAAALLQRIDHLNGKAGAKVTAQPSAPTEGIDELEREILAARKRKRSGR